MIFPIILFSMWSILFLLYVADRYRLGIEQENIKFTLTHLTYALEELKKKNMTAELYESAYGMPEMTADPTARPKKPKVNPKKKVKFDTFTGSIE